MRLTKSNYYRYGVLALTGAMLILLCFFIFKNKSESRMSKRAVSYLQNEISQEESEILNIIQDSSLIYKVLHQSSEREMFLTATNEEKYEILIYKDGELKLWSSNELIPSNINRLFKSQYNFIKLSNGFYEVIRQDYAGDYVVIGVLPIYFNYPINNQYLEEGFNFDHPILEHFKVANSNTGNNILDHKGDVLFSTEIVNPGVFRCPPVFWWIQFFGFLLLFSSGLRLSAAFFKEKLITKGLLILSITLVFSVVIHYSNLLLYVGNTSLFSSKIYASSQLISSLGILMVFTFLSFFIALFVNKFLNLPKISKVSGVLYDVYVLLLYLFNAVLFIITILIIKSIVDNSTISFDFYNFYTLSIYSLLGLVVFAIWFTILYISFRKVTSITLSLSLQKILTIGVACTALVYFVFKSQNIADIIPEWVALFFVLTFTYFYLSEREILKLNFINFLVIISIFSGTTAHIITRHIVAEQFDKQKDFISELLFERDFSEEFKLLESSGDILEDNFIKRYFSHPYLNDYNIEERIMAKFFSPFESRYNINVYLFNINELPLRGELDNDFNTLDDLFRKKSKNTVSPNIKYFSGTKESLKYLIYYPIFQDEVKQGHLFVEIIPKVFGSSSAYPELLISKSQQSKPTEDAFEYAIYKDGKLQKSKGEYEYTAELFLPVGEVGEYLFYNDQKYHHVVYNNGDNTNVVLSNPKRSLISPFSAFSYTFCFYLLIMVILWVFGLKYFLVDRNKLEIESQPVTLQRRIQISMISLVLSSLFIIGLITLIYFQNQYNNYHNDRLLRKANSLLKSLDAFVEDENINIVSTDDFEAIMNKRIQALAKIHSLDMNVFYPDGNLMISSQPDIFSRELVSKKLHPFAVVHLEDMGKSRHVQNEKIGNLTYLSAYIPYKNKEAETIAYLHFPYYSKQQSYRADISYFLVALVNVYVLLILTATAIALVLSRSITNSLTIIKERLSTIKLREKNVPIEWKNKDEIGMLVDEYNRMIVELEKSAELLAKSERESAWREMAKQVAHEIKNPLTPMKLSIQHLQRALKDDRDDIKELTEQVSNRLIEQIDSLTHIASEFSNFAKMPIAELIKVDLKEVIKSTSDLFQHLQHVEIITEVPNNPCYVKADKNQMIGVFNNLLKNATQAINEDMNGLIKVRLFDKEDVFRVEIEDNGVGIPDEKRKKVFEPNFTTKSSGTGLGLAISKNIIEKSGGSVWFESEVNVGTTFYLVLPKFEDENSQNKKENE